MPKLKAGIYKHYKGEKYEVIGIAQHSETNEQLVVYQALYGKKAFWVRPLKMFSEKVKVNNQLVPRFKIIND